MIIIRQKMIFRQDLQSNPHLLYVFGDNLLRIGMGGQAREMRGEVNAHGIATKVSPGMKSDDFFSDCQKHHDAVNDDFAALELKLRSFHGLVIPFDGIGSGLAELNVRAPKLFKFINQKLLNITT